MAHQYPKFQEQQGLGVGKKSMTLPQPEQEAGETLISPRIWDEFHQRMINDACVCVC